MQLAHSYLFEEEQCLCARLKSGQSSSIPEFAISMKQCIISLLQLLL